MLHFYNFIVQSIHKSDKPVPHLFLRIVYHCFVGVFSRRYQTNSMQFALLLDKDVPCGDLSLGLFKAR